MGGSNVRMEQNKQNIIDGDHRNLAGRNFPNQHTLESVYRQGDGKDLSKILEQLEHDATKVSWQYYNNLQDGQTVVKIDNFTYNPLMDKLFVTLCGFECYEGTDEQFIQSGANEITFNFPLNSSYDLLIVLGGTLSSSSFGSDVSNGINKFIQLTDVPSNYYGQAGKVAVVNPEETGLVFQKVTANTTIKEFNGEVQVEGNATYKGWVQFTDNCMIKGIKCTCDISNAQFELKVFSKDVDGHYIYYSGPIDGILWDIMDIPFVDESGNDSVYIVLENKGPTTKFYLQIYVVE